VRKHNKNVCLLILSIEYSFLDLNSIVQLKPRYAIPANNPITVTIDAKYFAIISVEF